MESRLWVVGSSHRRWVGRARLGGNPPGGSLAGNESSPHSSINDSTRIRRFSAAEGASGGGKGGFATLVGTAVTSSKAKLAPDEKQEESKPVDGDVDRSAREAAQPASTEVFLCVGDQLLRSCVTWSRLYRSSPTLPAPGNSYEACRVLPRLSPRRRSTGCSTLSWRQRVR